MKRVKRRIAAETSLLNDITHLIEQSKTHAVAQVNSTLTLLFWHIGKRINEFVLGGKRGEYGKQIVATVSRQLEERFGRGYEEKNLRRMMQFAATFGDFEIVATVSRQLSWSHFVMMLPIKTDEARMYYMRQAIQERWGVRILKKQIEQKSFERSTIADAQIPDFAQHLSGSFKDPYLFDFLNLPRGYLENDLESAILKELERFILEFGKGFAFVERQKRIIVDGEDYYLDLLFFHRKLKRLVAIDLKVSRFQAKFKGQMELYLKWLNKYERQEGEEQPIGLILCTEKSREQIELLEMHKDGIMVAEYWTELPPRKELETRLKRAYMEAKELIDKRKLLE